MAQFYSGLPQMAQAMNGWLMRLTRVRVTQRIEAGFVVNDEAKFAFQGVMQPFGPEKIKLLPEGQRSWKWWNLHCYARESVLVTNDVVLFQNKRYKVMEEKDYGLNNFRSYALVEDFQNG